MELHERLSRVNGDGAVWTESVDPFAEVKNRIHLAIVSELGPRLFEVTDGDSARAHRARAQAAARRRPS